MAVDLQTNEEHLKRMKLFAVSDANHDFDKSFRDIYDKIKDIGTPLVTYEVKPEYSPWNLISEFIKGGIDIKSLESGKPVKAITVTNYEYDICAFNAHNLTQILPFLYNAKLSDDLSTYEANLIIDALASSLWEDLREIRIGSSLGRINVLTNREVINDPATKTPPNSDIYNNNITPSGKRVVELYSYQDITNESVVYPAWLSSRSDFHNDFFSNYYISLSQLQFDDKQQSINVKFGRSPEGEDIGVYRIETAGEDVNSVNAVKQKLYEFSQDPSNKTAAKRWLFGYLLQQKRSGDSLQVLSSLDKTRLYKRRTKAGLEASLETLDSTYTYVGTNDIWNTSFGLLVGANIICMTNEGNRIYVFRTGQAQTPQERFIKEGRELLLDYNVSVSTHKMLFDGVAIKLEEKLLNEIKEVEKFVESDLSSYITEVSKQQIAQTNINKLLINVFETSVAISILHNHFRPMEPVTESYETIIENKMKINEILGKIRVQNAVQIKTNEELQLKVQSVLVQPFFRYIKLIDFFGEGDENRLSKEQKLYIAEFIGQIQYMAGLKLMIGQKIYEILNKISNSTHIQRKYRSQSTRKNFITVFQAFKNIFGDIATQFASPQIAGTKRKAANTTTVSSVPESTNILEEKLYAGWTNRLLLSIYEASISIGKKIRLTQGGMRNRRQRGGAYELGHLTANGNTLIQRQLNLTFLPIAADILIGNTSPFESDEERALFIRYILLGTAKWLAHLPKYEDADHFSMWAPIFTEMLRPIILDEDPTIQILHLRFFLGIWLTNETSKGFALPSEQWSAVSKEVGHTLLNFIFGYTAVDLLKTIKIAPLDSIVFRPDITDYKKEYENAYDTIVNLLDYIVIPDTPTSLKTETPILSSAKVGEAASVSILKKGLLTPEGTPSVGVSSSPSEPSLQPGSLSQPKSASPDEPLPQPPSSSRGGRKNRRKLTRKAHKNVKRRTRRHLK